MASDAKIKLLISSAIDDAGLKASKDQIDKLAKSINKANKDGSKDADKLAESIGKIGGPLEGIGKAAGGLVGKLTMLAGAFKVGWEIGNKVGDMLAAVWPWYDKYKNGVDETERAQRRFSAALKESAKAFDAAREAAAKGYGDEISAADAAVKHVTQIAEAYRAAHRAKSEFFSATDDAEMQRLQRERFEDVATMQRSGDFAAADQVNAAYDVLEAEMKAKKQLAAFDRESAALADEREAKELKLTKAAERKVKAAEKDLALAKERAESVEEKAFDSRSGTWNMTPEEYERESKLAEKDVAAASRALAAAKLEADKVAAQRGVMSADEITRGIRRATLADQLSLDADKARLAYDNITEANGNAAGLSWSGDYAQRVYDESVKSHAALVSVERNTADVAAKLDELLAVKGE